MSSTTANEGRTSGRAPYPYLTDLLRKASDDSPNAPAAHTHDGRTLTYRRLERAVNAVAAQLADAGLKPRDRVYLSLGNGIEYVIIEFAVLLLGGAVVMPNPRWKEVEHSSALALTSPAFVVAGIDSAALLETVSEGSTLLIVDAVRNGWTKLDTTADADRVAYAPVDPESESILPFSSGTTGLPKAVRHSQRSLAAAANLWTRVAGIRPGDRMQAFTPLFHIYGTATLGAAFTTRSPLWIFPRFDVQLMLDHIEQEGITIILGATPIALAVLSDARLEQRDLSSVRYFMWAATPVDPVIAGELIRRTGIGVRAGYGTSELPVINQNPVDDPASWRLDSVGPEAPESPIRIVDPETAAPRTAGDEGEIEITGPDMMIGYLPEEANADAFTADGWFRTGDLGWVGEDGWLHITGRLKDLIRVNAFQVPPAEIEHVLMGHPAVADCAVFGVPDLLTGERPVAAVVLRAGTVATNAELVGFVAEKLATYKHLKDTVLVDELPRNAGGKVLRRVLQDDYAASLDGSSAGG
ncbi:MAG: AMP-dependent synthetase and ligase [Microbacteriaceae bacterium]|nr:AMP-dependent synthetase and ligase [Microbacteriaceae bacterium]